MSFLGFFSISLNHVDLILTDGSALLRVELTHIKLNYHDEHTRVLLLKWRHGVTSKRTRFTKRKMAVYTASVTTKRKER